MAFDKLKNFMNVDMEDGVRGQAHSQSVKPADRVGDLRENCRMWLDVYVEGWEPYRLKHHCMVKMTKGPSPGETLPVMVDRENRERIDILWDEVRTVDELMSEGRRRHARDPSGQHPARDGGAGPPGDGDGPADDGQMAQMQGNPVPPGVPPTPGAGPPPPQPPAPPVADPQVEQLAESTGNIVLDRIAQLERLAKLRDEGVLTDSEFEAEKAKVLGA